MGLEPNTSSSQDPSLSDAAKILFPKQLKVMASMWVYCFFLVGEVAFSPLQWHGCLPGVVRTSQGQGTGLGTPMKVLVTQSCPTL